MIQDRKTHVRAFDGSLSDAQGLLAVEQATFNESPYSPQQVQDLLGGGAQHGWVALAEGEVVGFAIAFVTDGLSGSCWEIDLLAVHPHWRGQGLASGLIRAAAAGSPERARRARAVVATDNGASARAFTRAGFKPAPEICTLLIYRPADAALRPHHDRDVQVREAANMAEAAPWLKRFRRTIEPAARTAGCSSPEQPPAAADRLPRLSLLLAEQDGQPAGYAELIQVQTLLYHGAWIESLGAPGRAAREALVERALECGIAAGWDEIGAMVSKSNWVVRNGLVGQGFRSLGEFRWLEADLPLPATPPHRSGRVQESQPGAGRV